MHEQLAFDQDLLKDYLFPNINKCFFHHLRCLPDFPKVNIFFSVKFEMLNDLKTDGEF